MWNARLSKINNDYEEGIPKDLEPLFREIGKVYLPYLSANVDAVKQKKTKFDFKFGNVFLKDARYSLYRVWCLKEIRDRFSRLSEENKNQVEILLKKSVVVDKDIVILTKGMHKDKSGGTNLMKILRVGDGNY